MKRGAKRNGGPAYVGAFCFDGSLLFDYAQGRQRRVAGEISHTSCLLDNLELDYESMEIEDPF